MRSEIRKIKDLLKQNNLPEATKLLNKAKEQQKNYPALIELEGLCLAKAGDFENALSILAKAQKAMPKNAALYYNLAVVMRVTGYFSAAEEAIKKALRIAPFHPVYKFELSQILTMQEEHSQAILTLFNLIKEYNLFFPAYVALINYLVLDDQKDLAIKIYEAAVKGEPEEKFFQDRLKKLRPL